jgi:hypothetical protein
MADLVTLQEVRAWGEKTKLTPAWQEGLDTQLLGQVQVEVLGNVASVADTSTWIDTTTTPTLVKTIIAKMYVAWLIDRQYSEDQDLSAYAALLRATAMSLQTSIVNGDIDIPGAIEDEAGDGLPSVYPLDTTVDQHGNPYGPYFTMDAVF